MACTSKLPYLGPRILRAAFDLPDVGRLLYIGNPAGVSLGFGT